MTSVLTDPHAPPGRGPSTDVAPVLVVRHDPDGRLLGVEGDRRHESGLEFESDAGAGNGFAARWTADDDSVLVETDALGLAPLYVCEEPGRRLVSPSIAALLDAGAPRDLDWPALSVFAYLGYFVGGATAFRSIRRVPPGWRLEVGPGGVDTSQFTPDVAESTLPAEQLQDEHAARVRQAIRRRLDDGPQTVPLSGGRDSRHIALALHEAGVSDLRTVTIRRGRRRKTGDAWVAARFAEAVGATHREEPAGPFDPADERRKNRLTNFGALDHGWMWSLQRAVDGAHAVWDGLGGDVLAAGLYYSEAQHELVRRGDLRGWATSVIPDSADRRTSIALGFGSDASSIRHDAAVDGLAAEMERHLHHHNPVTSFYFWNRTRGCVALAPMCFYPSVGRVLLPLVDLDVWELSFAIPARQQATHAFHTEELARAYPGTAHLPFSGGLRTLERPGQLMEVAAEVMRAAGGGGLSISSRRRLMTACARSASPGRTVRLITVARRLAAYHAALIDATSA